MTTDHTSITEPHSQGCVLYVYANPKASRTAIAGEHDMRLKIHVASPPVDGAANKALIKFLASTLGTSKSKITLTAGHTSKRKTFFIEDINEAQVRQHLGLEPKTQEID